ncbi:hypothetical protein M3J09_008219 [Ascochyta lentis]
MKYLTIISLSTLAVLAAALPQGTNEVEDVEPVDIGTIPAMPDSLKDGAPVTSTAGDDVDPEKRGIEKRDFGIDIWQDPNQGGRHQTLHVNAQQCYNLGNSWNNAISSLHVPKGHGCIFYKARKCPQHGTRKPSLSWHSL